MHFLPDLVTHSSNLGADSLLADANSFPNKGIDHLLTETLEIISREVLESYAVCSAATQIRLAPINRRCRCLRILDICMLMNSLQPYYLKFSLLLQDCITIKTLSDRPLFEILRFALFCKIRWRLFLFVVETSVR